MGVNKKGGLVGGFDQLRAPDAPTISVSVGNASVTVTITNPSDTGGGDITSYAVSALTGPIEDTTFAVTVVNTQDNYEYNSPPNVVGEYDVISDIRLKEQALAIDFYPTDEGYGGIDTSNVIAVKKVLTNLILWLGAVICSVVLESSSILTLLLLSSALVSVLINSNSNSK